MCDYVNDILSLAADMESFHPAGDSLTDLIGTFADDELSEEDLAFAAAAGSGQSYEAFCRRFRLGTDHDRRF